MAYQKLQVGDGLKVIPSDRTRIPDPSSVINLIDGSTTAADNVVAMTADFSAANTNITFAAGTKLTEMNIRPGAIVYCDPDGATTTPKAYTVVKVKDDTNLTVNINTTGTAADRLYIFARATEGCILYVGTAGNLGVKMAAQSGNYLNTSTEPTNLTLQFKNLPNASFMPTQVVQVTDTTPATTASDIIALW